MFKVIFLGDNVVGKDNKIESGKVKLLKQIIDNTGARIVMCNSWRLDLFIEGNKNGEYIRKELKKEGIEIDNITTLNIEDKVGQIIEYLKLRAIENYVILDSDKSAYKNYKHYDNVAITQNGLSEDKKKEAIKILKRKD